MNITRVGVVGAGTMGRGVAQSLAQAGLEVVLVDVKKKQLDRARDEILKALRFHRLFAGAGKDEDSADASERIRYTTSFNDLEDSDVVIENIVENWPAKKEVYPVLDRICPGRCIFGANTSAIPITRIGGATSRPDRVIGMHFMNPVPLKKTVEVVRGEQTSDETVATSLSFLKRMGKEGIVVKDSPGFVTNRVLMLTINEAIALVQEQVATPGDVDSIFKSCFGHPMGPLETCDLIGLDTVMDSLNVLFESFNDPKFRPCPLLIKMVSNGELGCKSGKGFFSY